jgi:transposase
MTQREAAEKMGVTARWVRKLVKRMKKQGDAVVVHGLRGRTSNRKLSDKTQRQALTILRSRIGAISGRPSLRNSCPNGIRFMSGKRPCVGG